MQTKRPNPILWDEMAMECEDEMDRLPEHIFVLALFAVGPHRREPVMPMDAWQREWDEYYEMQQDYHDRKRRRSQYIKRLIDWFELNYKHIPISRLLPQYINYVEGVTGEPW